MKNKIFKITSNTTSWIPTRSLIVCAKDEQEAREIVQKQQRDGEINRAYAVSWMTEDDASCKEVSTKSAGVIFAEISD
jgi:hypothetical protein